MPFLLHEPVRNKAEQQEEYISYEPLRFGRKQG